MRDDINIVRVADSNSIVYIDSATPEVLTAVKYLHFIASEHTTTLTGHLVHLSPDDSTFAIGQFVAEFPDDIMEVEWMIPTLAVAPCGGDQMHRHKLRVLTCSKCK